ncbi:MAG: prolipoprotein diacylglyceryl transferase [Alphaproteobacteria bacterium]|nr:prolipoprotein diacylglyceryl transferase [Alphaproteobacteria bacterium]
MALAFPEIDPVAFSAGPVEIRWYALAYLAAFLLGWRYCLFIAGLSGGKRPNKTDIDDFLPWAIIGVIIGGRLGYVFFYQPEMYLANPLEIPKIWQGGMSFHGGLIGAIASIGIYSGLNGIPVLRLADMFACATPIGLFFGRVANFINGELFGRIAHDVPWAMVFPRGGPLPRHPSQIYEAMLEGLILFAFLFVLVRFSALRERPGVLSGVFLVGYSLSRMFVEQFREPDSQLGFFFDLFTMGQILSAPMLIGGAALIGWAALRKDRAGAA